MSEVQIRRSCQHLCRRKEVELAERKAVLEQLQVSMVEGGLVEGGGGGAGGGGEAVLVGVGKVVDALLNPCTITTHMLIQDTLTKEEAENQNKTLELRNLQVNLWTMKRRKDGDRERRRFRQGEGKMKASFPD